MMAGVFAAGVAPLGRRTSACRVTPSDDGIQASDQSASGYATPEAAATAGAPERRATERASAGRKPCMQPPNAADPKSLRFTEPPVGSSRASPPRSTHQGPAMDTAHATSPFPA